MQLPIRVSHPEPRVPAVAPRARLLIVDDEPLMLSSLSELLHLRGYEVAAALSGPRAIELLGAGDAYDLILLDLNMPGMHGFGVLEYLEQHAPETAVVIVSADNSVDTAIGALRKGVRDFIRKPYEPERLLSTVASALEKSKRVEQERETSERLGESERWYRFLVNSSPDLIYTLDGAGRFSFVNDRALAQLGYSRAELIGRHYSNLVFEEDLERAKSVFNERRTGKRASRDVELRLRRKTADASESASVQCITVELSACGIYHSEPGAGREFRGTYGVARNISERKRAEETIYHHAYHDILTGLPNRLLFHDRASLAIAQAKRSGEMFAILFLDLDRFKTVNDTLGHAVGDELLQAVAARLSKCIREGDTLARVGGDEFTLLLPQIGAREAAENAAKKILSVLSQPFRIGRQEYYSGLSIGIAIYPDDGETIEALVKNADVAMYDVKARGRNNYVFFSPARHSSQANRLTLESELRQGIARKQLTLFYQPQVALATGQIVGVEALLRWNHPHRGTLLPEDFIPIAQEVGAIQYISTWVIRTACDQLREWRDHGVTPVRLSINLAAGQIEQDDFVPKCTEVIKESNIDARFLEIEITESAMIRNLAAMQPKLRALSDLGVGVAIDDFGMGYSSLGYLRSLPIQALKIDRSFVADLSLERENSIVAAIISIAKGLRLRLTAEGVETQEQLEYLRAHGCEECQGYLVSKPLDLEQVTRLIIRGEPLLAV
jgi:diguanylate cyclase (GGDEF)-like protein/PAS domain S-box-containing protein